MSTRPLELVRHATSDVPADSSHIVMVPAYMKRLYPDMTPQAYVLDARVNGNPVTALCGHRWVPQKDPAPLPVCGECLSIYEQPGEHRDERNQLPNA